VPSGKSINEGKKHRLGEKTSAKKELAHLARRRERGFSRLLEFKVSCRSPKKEGSYQGSILARVTSKGVVVLKGKRTSAEGTEPAES